MRRSKINAKLLAQISRLNKSTKLLKELFNSSLNAGNLNLCSTIQQRIERNSQKKMALDKKLQENNKLSSWEQFLSK